MSDLALPQWAELERRFDGPIPKHLRHPPQRLVREHLGAKALMTAWASEQRLEIYRQLFLMRCAVEKVEPSTAAHHRRRLEASARILSELLG